MSTNVKLIDLTEWEPCLLGRTIEELRHGLREIVRSPTKQTPSTPAGGPVTPEQLRGMLSCIDPTFDGGSGTWVGIAKAILHGQLSATDDVDWEQLLDDWCSGALWRKRTGNDSFAVPTYEGKEELLNRLSGTPRSNGPTIGLGTIIKLAKERGYVGEIGITPSSTAAPALDGGDDADEIRRLVGLSSVAYDRERQGAAERLGIRVSVLDAAVKQARPSNENQIGQGKPLELLEPEPWHEEVRGDELLSALSAGIRRYVVLDKEFADSVALWVLSCHVFDSFVVFPRLAVLSPEKQCGKTTLLDVLKELVPRPLATANVSSAAVFRTIEMARPTLLMDEADTFLQDNSELRGVLNAGHRRGGTVLRCVGDASEPRMFSVWGPVIIAAIGRLPDTIEDRSVVVSLRRRRHDEPVDPLRLDRTPDLEIFARKAARWAADAFQLLGSNDPVMPGELFNRVADNWRPLLAVADAVGGEWPQRARAAAVAAVKSKVNNDDQSAGVLLLRDLKAIFEADSVSSIFSDEIVARLVVLDDRPWAEYSRGRPISKSQVAQLLKPFGVWSGSIRKGDRTGKGYKLRSFADAFDRYLADQAVTPSQPSENGD